MFSEQGTLTIVRRSSCKNKSIGGSFESSPPSHSPDTLSSSQSVDLDEILDNVDLTTDSLPAVDTPDACDKAALRYGFRYACSPHSQPCFAHIASSSRVNLHNASRYSEERNCATNDEKLSIL